MDGSIEPKLAGAPALGDASSSQRSTEALAEVVSKAAYELAGELSNALHGDRPITPSPSPVVNVVSQRSSPSSPSRSCSATSERKQSTEKKSRHAVLGKDFIAHRKSAPLVHARSVSTVASASVPQLALAPQPQAPQPTSSLHAERLRPVFSRQPQPKGQHALKATECKESHLKPASNLAFHTYPSAQGHQVRFQEQAGTWMAQVQDGWGREQELPVICAPDQTPVHALQQLSSKAPGQHKYWVHVLETHQPPWAPRIVYVGVLGVRGGGAIYSFDNSPPYHVYAESDSDDEADNTGPVDTLRGSWKASYFRSDGYWRAKVDDGKPHDDSTYEHDLYVQVKSDYPLSLSSNALDESEKIINYAYNNGDSVTGINFIQIISSPSEVHVSRISRRERRYERRQEHIRQDHEREKERLDTLREATKQRERQQLEAIEEKEAHITKRLASMEEREQALREVKNRQGEALHARREALHEEQVRLSRKAS